MSRSLAFLFAVGFVFWIWRRDRQTRPGWQPALWIPLIWVAILGSRPLSFWLTGSFGGQGNFFDLALVLGLAGGAIHVCNSRGLNWGAIASANGALVAFYTFLALTALWAEESIPVLKRCVKDLGAIPVLLVILTSYKPDEAIKAVFRRCAYVLLPLSVLCIKYIPELGRVYSQGGAPQYTGVTTQKNSLGEIVLVFGLVLVWDLVRLTGEARKSWLSPQLIWPIGVLLMGAWLLHVCDSKTSMVCLMVGSVILLSHRLPWIRTSPRLFAIMILSALPLATIVQSVPAIAGPVLQFLGRDESLTGRRDIWNVIEQHPVNPLVGAGYLAYWDVMGRTIEIDGEPISLSSAHNGYLEIYLDGGWLGVLFLVALLLQLGGRVIRQFTAQTEYGRLQLAMFAVMLLYNLSESMYGRRSPIWFAFLLLTFQLPRFGRVGTRVGTTETGLR